MPMFAGTDVAHYLQAIAKRRGDHSFLIWEPFDSDRAVWSYAAFADAARRFAAGLLAAGTRAGDHVLIHLDNCPEALIAWYGCATAGAIAVTTNTRSVRDDLSYYIQKTRAKIAIVGREYLDLIRSAEADLEIFAVGIGEGEPLACARFADLLRADAVPLLPPDPERRLSVQFTSGTTSRPKGVVWTHANALWGGKVSAAHEQLGPDDVHLVVLPLFHTNAQVYSVLAALWVGATIVLQPKFSASRFWPVACANGATWASLIPFCIRALAAHPVPPAHTFRSWGPAISWPDASAAYRVRTIGWWGMTETIAQPIYGDMNDPGPFMSIGRPAAEYGVHVVDADGNAVSPGQTGDLLIGGRRGESLFLEYLGDPDATAAAFDPEERLITGDRVTLGVDGFLYFADRTKDMLKVGGENVAASEIERVIMGVPGVRECAVVGRPDDLMGEVPVAFVIAATEASDVLAGAIMARCREQLADFKVPQSILFRESFPRATLEKVSKVDLRQSLADGV